MDANEGKQAADIVTRGKSSQEEYYRYMLLKEKLQHLKDAESDPLLTIQSEREAIELQILRKLIAITESSPEFSQIVDITGSRDRYEQARILSEVVYDKVRAETILGFYTPDKKEMTGYFTDLTASAASVRTKQLTALKADNNRYASATGGTRAEKEATKEIASLRRKASGFE